MIAAKRAFSDNTLRTYKCKTCGGWQNREDDASLESDRQGNGIIGMASISTSSTGQRRREIDLLKEWLTVPEAASMLGVSTKSVNKLVKQNRLEAYRPIKHLRINRRSIDRLQSATLVRQLKHPAPEKNLLQV